MKKTLLTLLVLMGLLFPVGAQITSFPWSYGFEQSDGQLNGWTLFDNDEDGNQWILVQSSDYAHGDSYCVASASYGNSGALTPDNWLVSPAVQLPDSIDGLRLFWWACGADASWADEYYSVYIATTPVVDSFLATTEVFSETTTATWEQRSVDLAPYAGQTVYIAFRHWNVTDMYYLLLDDIGIGTEEEFPAITYRTLTVVSNNTMAGTVTGGGTYAEGTEVTLTATANEGYYFLGWSDGNGESPRTVTVNGNATYRAIFYPVIDGETYERTVLVEDFETSQTIYAPQAEQRLAEGLAAFGGNYVHLTHHAGYYTDSLTSSVSEAMLALYNTYTWAPALTLDRSEGLVPGTQNGVVGNLGQASDIQNQMNLANSIPSYVSVQFDYLTYDVATRTVSTQVSGHFSNFAVATAGSARLNVYLVEDSIVSPQMTVGNTSISDYMHNNVVRAALTADVWGDEVSYADFGSPYTYTLPAGWDPAHCRLVAFVSNNGTAVTERQVLNATQTSYLPVEQVVYEQVTATLDNPQGGYMYYRVYDAEGNSLQAGRAYQGTTEVTFMQNETLCVEFATFDPYRQDIGDASGTEMLDSVFMNGVYYVFDSADIIDRWENYGYRLYSICGTYDSNVTFSASYLPYVLDTTDANLVVVNNSHGYVCRYIPGQGQVRVSDTRYYTLEEGEEFIFTFGTFMPGTYDGLVPDSARRLYRLLVDGVEIDFDNPETPGISIFNHTTEGYAFYNYNYVQDTAKHRVEFIFGPYEDTTDCLPVSQPYAYTTDEEATVTWMPSPSADQYTVLLDGEVYAEDITYNEIYISDLSANTEYSVAIVAHCYNGNNDTTYTSFTTENPHAWINVSTNGGYLYSYLWGTTLEAGEYYFDGFTGNVCDFWAETETLEYANEVGTPLTRAVLEAVYVNGVSIPLSDSVCEYFNDMQQVYYIDSLGNRYFYHADSGQGYTGYLFNLTFGTVDSVRFVFGPVQIDECEPVLNLIAYDVQSTSAVLQWDANLGNEGTYYIYLDGMVYDSVQSTASTVSYTFGGLTPNYTYNAYVGAKCFNGAVTTSEVVSFTTQSSGSGTGTVTVTKNGAGYMGVSGDDGYTYYVTEGTNTYNVPTVLYMLTMNEDAVSGFNLQEIVDAGLLSLDALELTSLYIDGQPIDLTGNLSTADYSLSVENVSAEYYYIVYTLTINGGSHTVEANFGSAAAPVYYNVSVTPNDVTMGNTFGGGTFVEGSSTILYALPQGGSTFVGWAENTVGNIVSMDNPMTVVVNADRTFYGVFSTADVVTLHDTVYQTETLYDTVYQTETQYDTVYQTETVHDTVYQIEYGDTLYLNVHDTLYLTETVHDTVYIYVHDTVYVGVSDVEDTVNVKLYSQFGQIVVEGAQGYDVVLYDAVGRKLDARRDDFGMLRFDVPASGTYLVRVGKTPARRIVVIR